VDLGQWLDEGYGLPGDPVDGDGSEQPKKEDV
jgi:endogenous inhibitor of DNA gyrase (YacG/DUF329 family)